MGYNDSIRIYIIDQHFNPGLRVHGTFDHNDVVSWPVGKDIEDPELFYGIQKVQSDLNGGRFSLTPQDASISASCTEVLGGTYLHSHGFPYTAKGK